jgi:hypothetical protein
MDTNKPEKTSAEMDEEFSRKKYKKLESELKELFKPNDIESGEIMEKPTCKTCVYWEKSPWKILPSKEETWVGICQRYAPYIPINKEKRDCEFCGEHQDFPKWVKECQK